MYCNLIVTRPFNQVFTYDTGNTKVKKGQIAIVPFGKSIEVGMIVEINVSISDYKIKNTYSDYIPSEGDRDDDELEGFGG